MAMKHDLTHTRRDRTERLRRRIAEIKPEDEDMIELLKVLKGILDLIDDGSLVTYHYRERVR